ncbi:hypothetical protein [Planctomyces sp. SH-PL14]|uniref:Abi-alpha family protein n=1 Tax=Planctomyces sp. SH-PL14 TaxID=1632864 RepID=UPI00078D7B40|nr:hypothetical protein [Planctomyces sp. SH-PL14]AMV18969.1 hypothetical protein VT03_13855 [Planctomyces sp. SH-PL14]
MDITTTALITVVAPVARDLLPKLLGKPCEVAGELLADEIYYWKWVHRLQIIERAQRRLKASGVAPKALPKGFMLPFLEDAGNVEEESLQELWAGLLESAVKDTNVPIPRYEQTLRSLSRDEAAILLDVASKGPLQLWPKGAGHNPWRKPHPIWIQVDWNNGRKSFCERTGVTPELVEDYLDHLETLDLLDITDNFHLVLSPWGYEFVKKCSPDLAVSYPFGF